MENRTTAKRLEDRRSDTLTEEEQTEKCTIQLQANITDILHRETGSEDDKRTSELVARTQQHHHTMPGSLQKYYTTEDQLIRLTQKIQNGFQMNKDTIAVFVDLENAYDKVCRQGLFIKMRDAGIHSNMYRWIKIFLTDRAIATQIDGVTSTK